MMTGSFLLIRRRALQSDLASGSCLSLLIKAWLPEVVSNFSVNIFSHPNHRAPRQLQSRPHPVRLSAKFKPPDKTNPRLWRSVDGGYLCHLQLMAGVSSSSDIHSVLRAFGGPSFYSHSPYHYFYSLHAIPTLRTPLFSHRSFSPTLSGSVSLPCRHSFILPSLCLPLAPCACTWLLAL